MKLRRILVPSILVLTLGTAALILASRGGGSAGLVDGRLRPCPGTPNCVQSEHRGEDGAVDALAFSGEPEAAFRSLIEFVRSEPRVRLLQVDRHYAHAVYRTPLLRFRDDVEFRLDPEAGVIHVRSSSRVGYSDLGANRERVESLRRRWRSNLGPAHSETAGRLNR